MPDPASGLVVGLTGGIGSGKSAAATIFHELGAAVVDSDVIAHELTSPHGEAMPAIRDVFGPAVIAESGALDRSAMRNLAFSDSDARARLEAILHPLIAAESERGCASRLLEGWPYVVLVVPLLIESGDYRSRVSRVLVVDCAEETQIRRVIARSDLRREAVESIMASQATRAQRLAATDDIIANDGDVSGLRAQVDVLHRKYMALAAKKPSGG